MLRTQTHPHTCSEPNSKLSANMPVSLLFLVTHAFTIRVGLRKHRIYRICMHICVVCIFNIRGNIKPICDAWMEKRNYICAQIYIVYNVIMFVCVLHENDARKLCGIDSIDKCFGFCFNKINVLILYVYGVRGIRIGVVVKMVFQYYIFFLSS